MNRIADVTVGLYLVILGIVFITTTITGGTTTESGKAVGLLAGIPMVAGGLMLTLGG